MNILFICSRNKWRSLTAETIFKENQSHDVKSAGTENDARVKVTQGMIQWADLIFVMEKRHKDRLNQKFVDLLEDKNLIVLDIPDEYKYMDEDLIETLKAAVDPYL